MPPVHTSQIPRVTGKVIIFPRGLYLCDEHAKVFIPHAQREAAFLQSNLCEFEGSENPRYPRSENFVGLLVLFALCILNEGVSIHYR